MRFTKPFGIAASLIALAGMLVPVFAYAGSPQTGEATPPVTSEISVSDGRYVISHTVTGQTTTQSTVPAVHALLMVDNSGTSEQVKDAVKTLAEQILAANPDNRIRFITDSGDLNTAWQSDWISAQTPNWDTLIPHAEFNEDGSLNTSVTQNFNGNWTIKDDDGTNVTISHMNQNGNNAAPMNMNYWGYKRASEILLQDAKDKPDYAREFFSIGAIRDQCSKTVWSGQYDATAASDVPYSQCEAQLKKSQNVTAGYHFLGFPDQVVPGADQTGRRIRGQANRLHGHRQADQQPHEPAYVEAERTHIQHSTVGQDQARHVGFVRQG